MSRDVLLNTTSNITTEILVFTNFIVLGRDTIRRKDTV